MSANSSDTEADRARKALKRQIKVEVIENGLLVTEMATNVKTAYPFLGGEPFQDGNDTPSNVVEHLAEFEARVRKETVVDPAA